MDEISASNARPKLSENEEKVPDSLSKKKSIKISGCAPDTDNNLDYMQCMF